MKILKLLFCIILTLLLSECTIQSETRYISDKSDNELKWYIKISNNFSNKEKKIIINSLREWQSITCNAFTFSLSEEYVDTSQNEFGVIKIDKGDGHVPDGAIGWTWSNYEFYSAGVSIGAGLSTSYFTQVVKHELGHAFWLEHYEGPEPTIMTPQITGLLFVQRHDAREFCRLHNCSEELKLCRSLVDMSLENNHHNM